MFFYFIFIYAIRSTTVECPKQHKLSDVTIAITTKLILLILDSDNELATVLPISRTRTIIDPNDNTRLILVNKSDDDSQQVCFN